MDEDNRIDIYTIPPNFAERDNSFRAVKPECIRTALIRGIGTNYYVTECYGKDRLYIGMIVLVPSIIPQYHGSSGESLLAFIASFFKF